MREDALYSIRDLSVRRGSGTAQFELFVSSLDIRRGECVAIVGASGCGKSTLLDVLSLISRPTEIGRYTFAPLPKETIDLAALLVERGAENRLAALRKRWMGYVLQTGGLLPFLSVERNIRISRDLLGLDDSGEVRALAESLSIGDRLQHVPANLSVGQRQRAAIARSIAHEPAVVIADEPTAALDPVNSDRVMELFVRQVERHGATLIVATHDIERVERFGLRLLKLEMAEGTSMEHAQARLHS